jgi:hypothetical protein
MLRKAAGKSAQGKAEKNSRIGPRAVTAVQTVPLSRTGTQVAYNRRHGPRNNRAGRQGLMKSQSVRLTNRFTVAKKIAGIPGSRMFLLFRVKHRSKLFDQIRSFVPQLSESNLDLF